MLSSEEDEDGFIVLETEDEKEGTSSSFHDVSRSKVEDLPFFGGPGGPLHPPPSPSPLFFIDVEPAPGDLQTADLEDCWSRWNQVLIDRVGPSSPAGKMDDAEMEKAVLIRKPWRKPRFHIDPDLVREYREWRQSPPKREPKRKSKRKLKVGIELEVKKMKEEEDSELDDSTEGETFNDGVEITDESLPSGKLEVLVGDESKSGEIKEEEEEDSK